MGPKNAKQEAWQRLPRFLLLLSSRDALGHRGEKLYSYSMIEAYEGSGPYVFVSYSHADQGEVYRIIEALQKRCHVWFDEGIHSGSDYTDFLAKKVKGAALFIFFISNDALSSEFCKSEMHFAFENKIPFLNIELKKNIRFTDDFKLLYSRFQRFPIYKYGNYDRAIDDLIEESDVLRRIAKNERVAPSRVEARPARRRSVSEQVVDCWDVSPRIAKNERVAPSKVEARPARGRSVSEQVIDYCNALMKEVRGLKGYTARDLQRTLSLMGDLVKKANELPMEELPPIMVWVSSLESLKMTIEQLIPAGPIMAVAIQSQLTCVPGWCMSIIGRLK